MSAPRVEQTPHGLATYTEPTFRRYPDQVARTASGELVTMRLCETFEGGRWEPFYAVVRVGA